jgi:hypothetical protein
MASHSQSKVLLVEGNTEKRLIPELMEQRGVAWELGDKAYAVDIDSADGLVTTSGLIRTRLKQSNLQCFGVVFDADLGPPSGPDRWAAFTSKCREAGIDLPDLPPSEGMIQTLPSGIRFGAWMMPNNRPPGMLETLLLQLLRPDEESGALFSLAKTATAKALEIGGGFKEVHHDKALIHTWLAWQDEPGAQLHEAIKFKILDANSPNADGFVTWFRDLFQV